ncbi:MAG: cobalt ECF transporter T component CbiQ [Syntrophobacteraceae bacterium]
MQPVFELFSDIFAFRDNALTRIDTRVKLLLAVLAILEVLLARGFAFPLSIFAASMAAMLAIRMPVRVIAARFMAPLGIALVLLVLQSLLVGSTELFSVSGFGWKLSVMREGLLEGALLGARVLGALGMLLLLSSTTKAHNIFQALSWFGVPKGWIEVSMLMYRYIFLLLDQAGDIMDAQRVRLGYTRPGHSLSSAGVLAGTVITNAIDQGVRTCEAMEVRGYKGFMPFGALPRIPARDFWGLGLVSGVMTLAFICLKWGAL